MLAPWKESSDKPTQLITKQRHHFANEDPSSQSYGFTSSRVQMWELNLKKSEHQRIDSFKLCCWRRLLRAPWTARRSNQWIVKEINSEYSLEGLMIKLNFYYFGLPVKSWSTGKDSDARKDWGQKEEWATGNEMVRQHHQLHGHESEQTLGDSGGQWSLVCYSLQGCKESDRT